MHSWLHQDIYWSGREWVYKDVPRRILAERYLEDENGELRDYKFFCFHGKPLFMEYDMGRFGEKPHRNFYSIDKTFLDINDGTPNSDLGNFPVSDDVFKKMKSICADLSADFQQVRVDLYLVNGKIYFGEMTFFDGGGSTVFSDDEWNYKFAEEWKITE